MYKKVDNIVHSLDENKLIKYIHTPTYSCKTLDLQVNSAYSSGLTYSRRYRYTISSGVL